MPLFTHLDHWPAGRVAVRVVSLVPSITELLYDLGMGERVVGITKFCVHPVEWYKTKRRVGGTKNVNTDVVQSLHPDLVIANREENVEEQVMKLAATTNVYLTDIQCIDDALKMIADIGMLTGKEHEAEHLIKDIRNGFHVLPHLGHAQSALYLIWNNPIMAAGGDTFISHLMGIIGLKNAAGHLLRYPEIHPDQFSGNPPSLILLSSEPFPFSLKHVAGKQKIFPCSRIELVDGEMFSWYGSRLLKAPGYFAGLINRWNQTP